jgi:hypothetical protein
MASRGRCSPVAMLYPRQNIGMRRPTAVGGGASPRWKGALGPEHEGGRRVRQSAAEIAYRCRGGRQWWDATKWHQGGGGVPFLGVSTVTDGMARGRG